MGDTPRTYLQWIEENRASGRYFNDAGPFDLRRYLVDCGRRVLKNTLLLEVGTEYRGRRILDVRATGQWIEYKVKCLHCGTQAWRGIHNMRSINVDHCRHCAPRDPLHLKHFKQKYPDPEPGSVYGELTVIRTEKRDEERRVLVQCSCGASPHWVLLSNLLYGKSTRCNACAKKKAGDTQARKYHSYADVCPDIKTRRRLLLRISSVLQRCNTPTCREYVMYGERGIKCTFPSRRAFLEHLVSLPGYDDPRLEIDRIDNDGDYAPGNIRFCTRKENMQNRRSIRKMQKRIQELEARLRHQECGSEQSVSDKDE